MLRCSIPRHSPGGPEPALGGKREAVGRMRGPRGRQPHLPSFRSLGGRACVSYLPGDQGQSTVPTEEEKERGSVPQRSD